MPQKRLIHNSLAEWCGFRFVGVCVYADVIMRKQFELEVYTIGLKQISY